MQEANRCRRVSLAERRRAEGRRLKITAASFALVGALAAGSTVAFLVDKPDGVVNTFQPVEVTCEIHETFAENVKTDVYVENTGDIEAYIRAKVIVSWMKVETVDATEKVTVLSDKPMDGVHYEITYGSGWAEGSDGYWYHELPVASGASTQDLIESLSLKEGVQAPEKGYSLSAEILSSAIQVEPDQAVVDAWGVTVTTAADGSKTISKPAASGGEGENA